MINLRGEDDYKTKKIMEDDSIAASATCVRIPVLSAHSESVYIETKEAI